jgi:beta-glucosidase/6-phospho-beta-glucosidase/beta-galactosidase
VTASIPFIGAFESTYQPSFDTDVAETTGHTLRWREDIDLLRSCGVSQLRYPVRWHRIETERGAFDWTQTDEILRYIEEAGMAVIVDLVHHTSYPRWVESFADPAFGPALVRYVEEFSKRYPRVAGYTIFNEPLTTFLLCGQAGIWPPRLHGLEGFLMLVRNVFPALIEASRLLREALPAASHVYVDVCEHHTSSTAQGATFAGWANDRRFFLTDLFLGHELDRERPFVREVMQIGGEDILQFAPGRIDVLGLDYYAHNQWCWEEPGVGSTCPPAPVPLSKLIQEYWERYRLPCVLGETNIRGFPSDRSTWLKYTLEQCELARAAGVPLGGYCWFPFVDSCDWDSILCRSDESIDPVGVYWLDDELVRRSSSMSEAFRLAAGGAPASELPAYELQPPLSVWLAGWLPQMSHWTFQPAPAEELAAARHETDYEIELKVVERRV